MTHEQHMAEALKLAERGRGWVNPNPMVGAVVVRDGKTIGSGWHQRYGEAHAEINALKSCESSPRDATLYVTLEPCCHHGKTPPCTEAILEAGINRVIIGSRDPNPLVCGGGVEILRQNRIEVIQDILREQCDNLNYLFFHYITHEVPYVLMKYAMTLDGKSATRTGASKWITGKESREHVHISRHEFSAIMTGIGTVLADDPLLTCRMEGGKNPVRIICDSQLRVPLNSQIVKTAVDIGTVVATASRDTEKRRALQNTGCRVLFLPDGNGRVNLRSLMEKLHSDSIDSVYLEGGAGLNYSMLSQGLVNRVHTYIAPKIFGGADAPSPVGGTGIDMPDKSILAKTPKITILGNDILLNSELR